jgi:hypothetical protein
MERQLNPWEIRLAALRYAQRERAKLEMRAFLWSIPLAALLMAGTIVMIEWLV